MGISHRASLARDRLGHAAVAVAEARDRGTARGVDDRAAVGGVQLDALAADRDGGNGAGTMQNTAHAETTVRVSKLWGQWATRGSTSCASRRNELCQALGFSM